MPRYSILIHLVFGLILVGSSASCAEEQPERPDGVMSVDWKKLNTERKGMPAAIEVWEGEDKVFPLKAWFVRIDPTSPDVDIEVLSASDADGRQSASEFASQSGACVIFNGGYFKQDKDRYSHIGLLLADGKLIHGATPGIIKDELRYPVLRSAIGFDIDNRPEIGWVSTNRDSIFIHDTPVQNAPGTPGEVAGKDSLRLWNVQDAIEAGPSLLVDSRSRITINEEVFFGTTIPDPHPRTAIGIDEEGHLLVMVVDGRQRKSRGVSLAELSGLMKAVGAVRAINLDGGGSSTLIVQDRLLNLPTGGKFQREIVSAIAIHCLNGSN